MMEEKPTVEIINKLFNQHIETISNLLDLSKKEIELLFENQTTLTTYETSEIAELFHYAKNLLISANRSIIKALTTLKTRSKNKPKAEKQPKKVQPLNYTQIMEKLMPERYTDETQYRSNK